jgi:GT2 family glycosyltransferase
MGKEATPIRLVIPAYATLRHHYLEDCLTAALAALAPWPGAEVIVVDNGGNGDLAGRLKAWPVTVLTADSFPSAAFARNAGAEAFRTGYLIFLDADVVVQPDCFERLLAPLLSGEAAATVGNYSVDGRGLGFAQRYKQWYVHAIYARAGRPIRHDFWTAIAAIHAEVFHALGGFDSRFRGANGEDQELGIRLTKAGHGIVAVPEAQGQHRHPYTLGGILRNDFRKGLRAVRNSRTHRVPLGDNRHAALPDRLAVGCAGLAGVVLPLAALGVWTVGSLALPGGALVAWLGCRWPFAKVFGQQGGWAFLWPALALMGLLDIVRGGCVMIGLLSRPPVSYGDAVPRQFTPNETSPSPSLSALAPTVDLQKPTYLQQHG